MKHGTDEESCFMNLLVTALADEIIIANAGKGSKIESLCMGISK
jgi:hypothetical protein